MYTFELTKEELDIQLEGLSSAIRIIASQIANNQNSFVSLKDALPKLQKIQNLISKLDVEIDRQDELHKTVMFSIKEKENG